MSVQLTHTKNYEDAITCAEASQRTLSMDEEVKEIIANEMWGVVEPRQECQS